MIAVRMVQTAANRIIEMIAMRHRLVPTPCAVRVIRRARGRRGMAVRMRSIDRDHVLVHVAAMLVVKMAVVQKVDVIVVSHRNMTTAVAMDMRVLAFMNSM
jgi:hypothetical protein